MKVNQEVYVYENDINYIQRCGFSTDTTKGVVDKITRTYIYVKLATGEEIRFKRDKMTFLHCKNGRYNTMKQRDNKIPMKFMYASINDFEQDLKFSLMIFCGHSLDMLSVKQLLAI